MQTRLADVTLVQGDVTLGQISGEKVCECEGCHETLHHTRYYALERTKVSHRTIHFENNFLGTVFRHLLSLLVQMETFDGILCNVSNFIEALLGRLDTLRQLKSIENMKT